MLVGVALWLGWLLPGWAEQASDLCLVPFPREVHLESGQFDLDRRLILEISQSQAQELGAQICAELKQAGYEEPNVWPLKTGYHVLRLSTWPRRTIKRLPLRPNSTPEDYVLQVRPRAINITGSGPVGLFHGAQTLRQLIRANRRNDSVPALIIRDWPALTWRAFQDDLTRGPSSTLDELKKEVALGSFFKLNIFTYYMEHQFAFEKHPVIGPTNGSLTATELKELVSFAQLRHVNILGNQQSFGHFKAILAHPEYAALRETDYLLCPTHSGTYELLNDLYSEVAPLLPFPFFNVCCDETDGLGTGPSKAVADQIGLGALYVQHIRRVHDLIVNRYQKRMMMWGDIILRHPEHLGAIPKDTILLTWGYNPRPSFEDQIVPFAKAGYDFFVCPGVVCWGRVLPDFGAAMTNIHHFVRDGLKHGAIGMLNTAWDDDGETFNAPNWHGFAWGAECAWNGGATKPSDFNRRIGPVLFGEKAQAFGQAIERLSTPGLAGMPNRAFWQFSFDPIKASSPDAARAPWDKALEPIRLAIADLQCCRKGAVVNADLLDYFLFGAQRMELRFQREVDRLQAILCYRNARRGPWAEALTWISRAEEILRSSRDIHQSMKERFAELWGRENKPYSLDWTLGRYDQLLACYDAELDCLARIRKAAEAARSLPPPSEAKLEMFF
jgi:hexosaminidase